MQFLLLLFEHHMIRNGKQNFDIPRGLVWHTN